MGKKKESEEEAIREILKEEKVKKALTDADLSKNENSPSGRKNILILIGYTIVVLMIGAILYYLLQYRILPISENYIPLGQKLIFGAMMVAIVLFLNRLLKQILAYSTVSQYGYVVLMFGIALLASPRLLVDSEVVARTGAYINVNIGPISFQPAEFAKIDIPVLTLTGYYSAGQAAALHYFAEHRRHAPDADHQRPRRNVAHRPRCNRRCDGPTECQTGDHLPVANSKHSKKRDRAG